MKKKILLNLIFMPLLAFGQGYWTKEVLTNNPAGRSSAVTFTCLNRSFVLGGDDSSFNTIDDFYELDINAKTWKKPKSKYPGKMGGGQVAFVVDSFAYIGLGYNSTYGCSYEFYKYDVLKDAFTKIANFPGSARFEGVAFSANGKGYVGLGMDDFGEVLSDFYEYNPKTNSWKKIANFPGTARYSGVATSFKENGIVGLGATAKLTVLNDLYSYNSIDGVWKKLDDFNVGGRYENVAFSYQGIPYIGLGFLEGVGIDKKLYQFDSFSGTWNLMEINNNFTGFSSSVFVFDDLFVVGFGKKNNTVLNTEFYSFRKWGMQLSSIEKPMIQVHPNPCNNQLIINLNELTNVSKLSILDYSGKLLMDIDLNLHPNSIIVDISNLAQGIYFVKMKDTNIRFVKN
jgi:N-acetylneuraminic acid mutarotase